MLQKTILIVEDDHDTRVELRQVLEPEGFFVVTVANGRDAWDILQKMPRPDFILLDINLPLMTGDELLGRIKDHPRLKETPVIQMSAATSPRRPGTYCAFSKPLDLRKLLEALRAGPGLEGHEEPVLALNVG